MGPEPTTIPGRPSRQVWRYPCTDKQPDTLNRHNGIATSRQYASRHLGTAAVRITILEADSQRR